MEIKSTKRYLFIIYGIIINMCMGSIYSWSVFRKPLEGLLDINSSQSGLPFMVFLISYAVTMPFAGAYIEKYGPRVMTFFGGVFVTLAWVLSSLTHEISFLAVTYGILGGIGVGIVYGAPMAVAAKWFPEKKGFAVGLTLSGFGLSPFITAPISRHLIEQFGVFLSFRILGIAFFIIISLLALPLKFPLIPGHSKNKDKDIKHKIFDTSFKLMLKSSRFYLLWFTFFIGTFIGLMAISISSPVAEEIIGLTAQLSSFTVALFAIFNGVGRPLFGFITDKIHFKKAATLSLTLVIIASVMMLTATEGAYIVYILAFSIFWLNLGGWLAIAPTTVSNIFGATHYARNYGFLFTAYGFGAVAATLISGSLKDTFGSYQYSFYPAIAAAVFGIIIVLFFFKDYHHDHNYKG